MHSPYNRSLPVCFLVASLAGCGGEPDSVEFAQPAETLSFEEFLALTPYDPQDDSYLVEGDIAIFGRDALEEYFYSDPQDSALTIATTINPFNGAESRLRIPEEDQRRLTYCIRRPFISVDDAGRSTDRTLEVAQLMHTATRDWETAADIDFVEVFNENCSPRGNDRAPRYTNFVVVPFNFSTDNDEPRDDGALGRAFFPRTFTTRREVRLDPQLFTSDFSPVGIVRHELGHILGFRHENAVRPEAPQQCEGGTFETLTPYDSRSVMTTPACLGFNSPLTLTSRDRSGTGLVYGAPVSPLRTRLARELLRDLYHVTLLRTPDTAGFNFWESVIRSNRSGCDTTVRSFFTGPGVQDALPTNELFLDALYHVILDRTPDAGGRSYWLGRLRNGLSRTALVNNFIGSEFNSSSCGKIH
ncbi:MAG: DUF4214 domain-containing protein [Myxococcota bacterium]